MHERNADAGRLTVGENSQWRQANRGRTGELRTAAENMTHNHAVPFDYRSQRRDDVPGGAQVVDQGRLGRD